MRPRSTAVALVLLASVARAQGPSATELEVLLPTLAGRERARVLSQMTELLQGDDPRKALEYGAQALETFERQPDPLPHITTLSSMAWAHVALGQYDEAVARGEQAVRMAEEHGGRAAQADALNHLGSIAQRRGDPARALELFTRSLEAGRQAGSEDEIATSLNNLGFVYATDLADYDRGLEHHLEALAIRERLGDDADIALSLNNIGIVYYRMRQYDRALDYFGRALVLRRKVGPPSRLAAILHNIGDVHLERKEYDQALESHREAFEIRRRIGDRSNLTRSHRALGTVYLAMGRFADAERELEEALALGDAVGDKGHAVENRLTLSAVDRQRGRPGQAVSRAQQALDIASAMSARELQRRSLEELAAALEAEGRPAEALAAYRRFKDVSDEILDEGKARRIASLEKRYEREKRERELERLVSAKSRQRDMVAGATVLLGFGGLALYRRRVEKARLAERLSATDPVTELKNRRYVHQTIAADVAASIRRHREAAGNGSAPKDADLVFFLVDIDGFKSVNDAHGHAAGDRVLAGVARLLESACRQSDVVARWGGDEFLVVARFTERAQAAGQAERLRRTLAEGSFPLYDGRVLAITCSVGFAAFPFARRELEALDWEQVVAVADYAVYAAKGGGRNSWVGLGPAGDSIPNGPPTADTLDAWLLEGLLVMEKSVKASAPAATVA